MEKIALGILFGLLAGAFCRWVNIPAPAPPTMIGALMVFAVSCGYYCTDRAMARSVALHSARPNTTRALCGGHSGDIASIEVGIKPESPCTPAP